MITFASVIDHRNIGDIASTPFHYAGAWARPAAWEDLRDLTGGGGDRVVVGGGGLFCTGLEELVKGLVESGREVVVWGAGLNRDGQEPEWLRKTKLVGMRDRSTRYSWVPCPSCLHPAFREAREQKPLHRVVAFSHREYPVFSLPDMPAITNDHRWADFEKVIQHLASGETVVTTSYHGLYWAALLGRKALLADGRPGLFKFMLHWPQPVRTSSGSLRLRLPVVKPAPANFLEHCAEANLAFQRKVEALWS